MVIFSANAFNILITNKLKKAHYTTLEVDYE